MLTALINRRETPVLFMSAPDEVPAIRDAWERLEAVVPLRGRRFVGVVWPSGVGGRRARSVAPGARVLPAPRRGRRPRAGAGGLNCGIEGGRERSVHFAQIAHTPETGLGEMLAIGAKGPNDRAAARDMGEMHAGVPSLPTLPQLAKPATAA
jgi:hypothetical protein